MIQETRICQNCRQNFTVASEDFEFYKKIEVSPPTFCPECRLVRRFLFRNERTLFHGMCAATGKKVITMFNPESGLTVYDRDYWWSDSWDPMSYGRDYDFTKPFFAQFRDLLGRVPLPNLASSSNVNSPYVNHSQECKNSYLVFASHDAENVMYSMGVLSCKDSLDLHTASSATECYDNALVTNVNKVRFSYGTEESLNSDFLQNCRNMSDCLGCANMRNGRYCIFNKQYSREEYERKRAEYDFGSYRTLTSFEGKFREFAGRFPRRFANLTKCVDVTGDNCITAKNCHECFDLYGEMQDSKYSIHGLQMRDGYDMYGFGVNAELMYEGVDVGINASKCIVCVLTHGSQNAAYTYNCYNCNNILGCIGLRKAEYCILNKQYTKDEYENMRVRIVTHLNTAPFTDARGLSYGYGEFFPTEISPFAYNETIAQEYFPLAASEAVFKGYRWKTEKSMIYEANMKPGELPDHIRDVPDSIVGSVIECAHRGDCAEQCATAFKITPTELDFYRKYSIALPRLCSNCRHYSRLKKRTPFALWQRRCQCGGVRSFDGRYANLSKHEHGTAECVNSFATAYSPQRSDIVYCEQCYQKEI